MATTGGSGILILLGLTFLFWVIPLIMIFVGALQMKKNPPKSKKMIIIAGIWLLIGAGFCGFLMI